MGIYPEKERALLAAWWLLVLYANVRREADRQGVPHLELGVCKYG